VPYLSIPDEQVTITDADRNDYYNKHRESYRLNGRSRTLQVLLLQDRAEQG
jgi:hypothetical protein